MAVLVINGLMSLWRDKRYVLSVIALVVVGSVLVFQLYEGTGQDIKAAAKKHVLDYGAQEIKLMEEHKYVFSLTTTQHRSRFICTVVESLWAQTLPPQDIYIFHGPEFSLPACSSSLPFKSFIVPDTGPSIKLRHLLLPAQNNKDKDNEDPATKNPPVPSPQYDVIVVDDDCFINPDLAKILLRQSIRFPEHVLINNPNTNYEHPRVIL